MKPRIALLVDIPNWAFHTIARSIERHLSDRFEFTTLFKADYPTIEEQQYDLIHVFYEFEDYHREFLSGRAKVVRGVYSHYWEVEHLLSPMELYRKYLSDAHAIVVPSMRLLRDLQGLPPPLFLFPEGIDGTIPPLRQRRTGPLVVGWAGKDAPIKRLDMLKNACDGVCELTIADGTLGPDAMQNFYSSIDIIACTSIAEGCPRPVIEAMALGAYPVSFDVGIVPEVVIDGINGIIVKNQTTGGMREALEWCVAHPDDIRRAGRLNIEHMRASRDWQQTTAHLADIYYAVL